MNLKKVIDRIFLFQLDVSLSDLLT